MAHQNELTEIVLHELKLHGIKGQCRDTNGGHIEIAWQVCPEKAPRQVIMAKTTSDWRSRMNMRAQVRRYLRADNIQLVPETKIKPKKLALVQRALELPKPDVLPVPDQLTALRAEVSDLTELVIRLSKLTATVRDAIGAYVPKPQALVPPPQSSRSVKLVEFLSFDRWVGIATLPRDTGLSTEQIKLKLNYLKQHGQIEIFQGQVRLKANAPKMRPPGRQPKAKTNGHAPNVVELKKRGRPRKRVLAPRAAQ